MLRRIVEVCTRKMPWNSTISFFIVITVPSTP